MKEHKASNIPLIKSQIDLAKQREALLLLFLEIKLSPHTIWAEELFYLGSHMHMHLLQFR